VLVYLATNTVNGKKYIGKTVRTLQQRWSQHKSNALTQNSQTYFHRAIRKYGAAAFTVEVLGRCNEWDEENLNTCERLLIRLYDTRNPDKGYNQSDGCEGNSNPPADVRVRIGSANRDKTRLGRPHSLRTRQRLSEIAKARKASVETRQRMSESIKRVRASKFWSTRKSQ
jgi:group I intron endonuclease